MAGSCEGHNKPLISIKAVYFLTNVATVSFSMRTVLIEVSYIIVGLNKIFVGTFPSLIVCSGIQCRRQERMDLYHHVPTRFHGVKRRVVKSFKQTVSQPSRW